MPTFNEALVDKVRKGELAIENTDNDMTQKLLDYIFPKDSGSVDEYDNRYYQVDIGPGIPKQSYWVPFSETLLPSLPVSSFFIEAKEEDGWIRVEDRLPEIPPPYEEHGVKCVPLDTRVIVYDCISNEVFEEWYSKKSGFNNNTDITHWQPLPEPPKP